MTDITDPLAGGDDDLMIDFTDVQEKSFEPIPPGWYELEIVNYETRHTKNAGKKLPAGTPGTNWEFEVTDEGKFEGRKVWTNHWHHPETLGFMKSLLRATDAFTEEQLAGPMKGSMRDDVIGCRVRAKVIVRKGTGGYSDSNEINAFKSTSEVVSGGEAATSMLP